MADETTILTADEIIAALGQITNNEDFIKIDNALEDLMAEQEIATQKALLWAELREALSNHLEEYNIDIIASVEGDIQTVFTITKDNLNEVFVPDVYNQINISGSSALVIDSVEKVLLEKDEEAANLPTNDEEDWYEAEDDWEDEEGAEDDEGVQDDIDPGDSDAFIEEEDYYNEEEE